MGRRQLVRLALLIRLRLDTPVRGEHSPAVFATVAGGAYSDSLGPELLATAFAAIVIPFRFVDGIMRACQRYSTHGTHG
jgi:hypothetical protein